MRLRLPWHLSAGLWGERQAERLLASMGWKILGRRVRVGLRDEIDIVARDGEVLVFVEVKTRAAETYGRPIAAVDRSKRRALGRAALGYMRRLKQRPAYYRFDVVEVIGSATEGSPVLRHVPSAFTLDPRYFPV